MPLTLLKDIIYRIRNGQYMPPAKLQKCKVKVIHIKTGSK